jgi:hypothetical protein
VHIVRILDVSQVGQENQLGAVGAYGQMSQQRRTHVGIEILMALMFTGRIGTVAVASPLAPSAR